MSIIRLRILGSSGAHASLLPVPRTGPFPLYAFSDRQRPALEHVTVQFGDEFQALLAIFGADDEEMIGMAISTMVLSAVKVCLQVEITDKILQLDKCGGPWQVTNENVHSPAPYSNAVICVIDIFYRDLSGTACMG